MHINQINANVIINSGIPEIRLWAGEDNPLFFILFLGISESRGAERVWDVFWGNELSAASGKIIIPWRHRTSTHKYCCMHLEKWRRGKKSHRDVGEKTKDMTHDRERDRWENLKKKSSALIIFTHKLPVNFTNKPRNSETLSRAVEVVHISFYTSLRE